ncbi:MAG: hypothetical protein J6V65_03950, partial [Fibrobacterales bacterium]|nr:hypothetical protein [Fibrobacterales bacterium]
MTSGSASRGAPLAALLVLFLLAAPARSADVIGFWSCYDSCIGSVTSEMRRYLTQVNLFNFQTDGYGGLSSRYPFSSTTVSQIKSGSQLKVFMTIGGASASSGFSGSVSPSYRTTFVNAIVSTANELRVDGVDIDWEYPNTVGSDPENFVAFLRQLKSALG